ncbi:Uncharacterized conserved protein, DUF433 family [Quadrisphaera granulorum]|uniref:Uncharacterized protein (DUF433 family) n=1 Tax=Quadrisphaera granulorum TaxID=317664 RepID=A0A315ZU49_9ACTN|nr:DUF433 domain-containing protein [Quadrisphaera granulorum]PWJ48450.1 uncharacterized protein (DUF433 family) [Quadrisphaera granulorum]SZE98409.1 Uncharacterized conserved protein, DUF433 family [Quadrisphaera granulorum]
MAVSILDVPVMPAREAARQLRIPATTLQHWLEGGDRRGTFYEPVLRTEPRGTLDMTWGEVVEARYLRAYRSSVSMQRLRPFISEMRQQFQVRYPLAHFKPFVGKGRELVFQLQESTDVPEDLWLVFRGRSGQYRLNPLVVGDYVERIDFADTPLAEAERIRPLGKDRAVVIDPRRSSGAATVRGVRTDVLAERVRAGGSIEELANEFDLAEGDVHDGLTYAWSRSWPTVSAA